jgi:hypothetical protein
VPAARSALAIKAMPRGWNGKPRGNYGGARILRSSEQIDERDSRCGVAACRLGVGDLCGRGSARSMMAGPGDS